MDLIHTDISAHLASSKPFFISKTTRFIVVKMPSFHPSIRTYAVFFDETYAQKSLYITTSFLGTYAAIMLILIPLFFIRSKKTLSRHSHPHTNASPTTKTQLIFKQIDPDILKEALLIKENLISNAFLKGNPLEGHHPSPPNVRPHHQILQYKILFEKTFQSICLLKLVHQKSYDAPNFSILCQYLMSLIKHFYPTSHRASLYLWNPKKNHFRLSATYKETHIESYLEHTHPPHAKPLYPKIGILGKNLQQHKPFQHHNPSTNTVQLTVPFIENQEQPLILQMDFPLQYNVQTQDIFFLQSLLRHLSSNLNAFFAMQNKAFITPTQLFNEPQLHHHINLCKKRIILDSLIHLCLLEVMPTPPSQTQETAIIELVQKRFADLLKTHRDAHTHVYHLSQNHFVLLLSHVFSFPKGAQDILNELLKTTHNETIHFFNQEIRLQLNIGMAQMPSHKITPQTLLDIAKKDLINYKRFRNDISKTTP